jgi:CheY-like chemotaxis protein
MLRKSMNNPPNSTILIADDSVDARAMLRMFLETEGYKVIEAENGRQAIETAKSERPDLILMDLNMPVLNGIEAAIEIRRHSNLQEVPILASSGNGMFGIEFFLSTDALGDGYIEYLSKPFNFGSLVGQIEAALLKTKLAV